MAHLVESEALVHHGCLSVDDRLTELLDDHILTNNALHLLLDRLLLHFESVFVLTSNLASVSLCLLDKLRIELVLQVVDDCVLSVLDFLGYALELQPLQFFNAVLVLEFAHEGVHLGQGVLITALDVQKDLVILWLFFLIFDCLLALLFCSVFELFLVSFTGLIRSLGMPTLQSSSFLQSSSGSLVDLTTFAEHAACYELSIIVPEFVIVV